MIKVTVPATSANLGIGYDTLGMAVSLYSHFTFDHADTLTITGCPEEFQNRDNMVYVAFEQALEQWGMEPFPISIDIQTEIPVARGVRGRGHYGRGRAHAPHRDARGARRHGDRARRAPR